MEFIPDFTEDARVHSLTEAELDELITKAKELKRKVYEESYELTIEDQRVLVQWRRSDRETKFILNQAKPKKEKVIRVKKPKKLSRKALGELILKEQFGEELTEDEKRNKHFNLTGEIL